MNMSQSRKPGVTIISPTMRRSHMHNLFQNYARQRWSPKELIIVVNRQGIDLAAYRKLASRHKNVRIYRLPDRKTIGQCLNLAAGKATYPYIAKFDDDDYYGPGYIPEAMRAFLGRKADLVGKSSFFFYFPHRRLLLLRKRGFRPYGGANKIAGATIMFHKRVWRKVKFGRLRQGSDVRFVSTCQKRGFKMRSTTRYNFAAIRRANRFSHTWKASDRVLLSDPYATRIRTRNYRKHVDSPR